MKNNSEFDNAYELALNDENNSTTIWPDKRNGNYLMVPKMVFSRSSNQKEITDLEFWNTSNLAKEKISGNISNIEINPTNLGYLAAGISRALNMATDEPYMFVGQTKATKDRINVALAGMSLGELNQENHWSQLEKLADVELNGQSLRPYIISKMQEYQLDKSSLN